MSQDGAGTEEVDGVVAVVAAMSAKNSRRRPASPPVVVVAAVPEYRVRPEQEDGVALLTDAEPPATRDQHVDIFAPCQLLTRSFEEEPGISWYKAVFLIVNAALGAGLLNFPRAFHEAGGIVTGNLVHGIFTALALGSLVIIAKCGSERNCKTYQELVLEMCSLGWGMAAALCIAVYCFVTCITFIIIIGDQFDRAFASFLGSDFCHSWYLNRKFTMTVSSLLLIFPCCLKRIDGLRYMSYVGVVSIWYLAVIIVTEFYSGDYDPGPINDFDVAWTQVFDVVPTICFGYQCHVSCVPIYSCLKDRKASMFTKSCVSAVVVCFLVYTISANYGYLTFGSTVDGDVLLSYDATKPQVLLAVILLAIKSWTTYPILMFCVREAIGDLYVQLRSIPPTEAAISEPRRRRIIALLLWAASMLMAIFTPNINIVVKLLGSMAAIFIFVFPGMLLLQEVLGKRVVLNPFTWKRSLLVGVAMMYVVVGMFAFGLAFTLGVEHIIHPDSSQPLCE
ncbi:putative sodium-coupled neutral amino acid transporter 7 [Eriocheir sinensis]|uniref:putative sodium-coupled neutral amino acid transporter 7 n=1 Tax=Eriocheir sinensis TaxID=95602 RepID=UPI0021C96990|nr:putative sodium-coupled neutral amino acid transporter 7 [Eriocheir sinensis]XP_050725312.1 putative sodium-coupled neutral amino acid transporter 7 [Eriocheir sinensis]XP_050725313.1 putative sodium-coupled neutral amino acid transporter 7 [Eriocheir sinensis]